MVGGGDSSCELAIVLEGGAPGTSYDEQELVVELPPATAGAELRALLAPFVLVTQPWELVVVRTGALLRDDLPVLAQDLLQGDRLRAVAAGTPRRGRSDDDALVVLRVLDGSGRVVGLRVGEYVVGRGVPEDRDAAAGHGRGGDDAYLGLDHPTVSRLRHARFRVERPGHAEVEDLGSANGTWRDGVELRGPRRLADGDVIELGSLQVRVEIPAVATDEEAPHLRRTGSGRMALNRPPHFPRPAPSVLLELPTLPVLGAPRRLPLAMALLPVAAGAVTYLFFRDVRLLAFVAIGPLAALWSWLDDRRSARRELAAAVEEHRHALAAVHAQALSARADERAWREERWPRSAAHRTWVRCRDQAVWRRRPDEEAFATVRLGRAELPPLTELLVPGGDRARDSIEGLRADEQALLDELALLPDVPAAVSLVDLGVLGIAGPPAAADAVARHLVAQLACEHSPRDLVVTVLAPGGEARWAWARWLPHAHVNGASTAAVATDDATSEAAFQRLEALVAARTDPAWAPRLPHPHVVAVVAGPLAVPPADVAALLARAPAAGVSVVWLADDVRALPGECRGILDLTGPEPERLTTGAVRGDGARAQADPVGRGDEAADGARPVTSYLSIRSVPGAPTCPGLVTPGSRVPVRVETLRVAEALEVARGLAPLVDVTAATAQSAPTAVTLFEVLDGGEVLDADGITTRWKGHPGGLRIPVGADATGMVELDLGADPHALVAGTTGSGKSQLLQTLLLSCAATYPPEHVSFVLVDYKGGAAFAPLARLPHTVGLVTNLDGPLARRALIALEAEVRRREALITGTHGAPDLETLRRRDPALAPPELVLVVDEFAVLVRQLEGFVEGLVDIAAKGRSLGIHLVLATQSPQGVVSPKIADNASLRVALRLNDAGQSRELVGSAEAATIAGDAAGRAVVRVGGGTTRLVQTAWSGAPVPSVGPRAPAIRRLGEPAVRPATRGRSQREVLLDAVAEAFVRSGAAPPPRPWLPELPAQLALDTLPVGAAGLLDLPAQQRVDPWRSDLAAVGNLLVLGGPRSGRTGLLATLAVVLARQRSPERLQLYVCDLGRHELAVLADLPHTVAYVDGTDVERVYALLDHLQQRLERRRRGQESRDAQLVLLLDGFEAARALMDGLDGLAYLELLTRLVAEGPGLGLHAVVTAERRRGLPARMVGAAGEQLVLPLGDPTEYAELGLGRHAGEAPALPGRALTRDGDVLQVARLARPGEDEELARRAAGAAIAQQRTGGPVRRLVPLPDDVPLSSLASSALARASGRPGPGGAATSDASVASETSEHARVAPVPLGVLETGEIATVPLGEVGAFLVVGGPSSGRSTALHTVVRGVLAARPRTEVGVVASRRSPVQRWASWRGEDGLLTLAGSLRERAAGDRGEAGSSAWPVLVVLDDADDLADFTHPLAPALDLLVRHGRDADVLLVAAVSTFRAVRASTGWLARLREARHGLLLVPTEESREVFPTTFPLRRTMRFPPGRGVLVDGTAAARVQVARDSC